MALIKTRTRSRRLTVSTWLAAKEELRQPNEHIWLSCHRCALCYERRYEGTGSITCPGRPSPIVVGQGDFEGEIR